MTLRSLGWFQDVGQYLGLAKRKNIGRGVDYTSAEFSDPVGQVLSRLHPGRMKLRVKEIIDETPTTKTFRFERTDGPIPPFRAGQYVNLFLEIDGVSTSRPFSISSAPGSDALDLTVRMKPGGFVSLYLLERLKLGDELESTGPVGHFYHEPLSDGTALVFLAGGSGVTPFLSMIREQKQKGWPLKIQLLYGSRTNDDVIFADEMARLAEESDKFSYALVISEPPDGFEGLKGFLDAELIRGQVGDLKNKTYFICGPRLMYDLCLGALTELGIPQHRIRREAYGPPNDITNEPGWPKNVSAEAVFDVDIEDHGSIQVKASEPLLNSLERNGIVIPSVCRSGGCSACRTKVLSGEVFMSSEATVREADLKYGYIHPCLCYPVDNLRIRLP